MIEFSIPKEQTCMQMITIHKNIHDDRDDRVRKTINMNFTLKYTCILQIK